MKNASDAVTRSFLIGVPVVAGAGALWIATQPAQVPACIILERFGILCPGCGGTRAVLSLLQGDVLGSLHFNPLVLVLVVLAPVTILGTASMRRSPQIIGAVGWYLILATVVYSGLIRNLTGVEL